MRVTKETQAAVADAAWAVATRLPEFGYAEISAELKITMEHATRIVRAWEKAGACGVVQSGIGLRKLFRVTPDYVRPAAPQGRTPEENMWTAMRGLKSFTPTDLRAHSETDTVAIPAEAAQAYCRALLAAGYLKVERKAVPGQREAIYRLIRATGPRPPRERRLRAVVDGNTGAVALIGGGQ
ncbi:hypothetical protein RNZ50_15800 [Paracoccaceae bacterium Fryx2]|nr:hypothetical protein [Paracoccaceae bacterium Fryx2]